MSRFEGSRRPRDTSNMVSLKVDNLTFRTDMQDLDRLFGKYGDLGDIYIPRDWEKGGSRGFAFVRFYKKGDAEDAIDALDGATCDGREIRVQHAKYDRPTSNYVRGGGGGGGRGRGFGGGGGRYQNRSDRSPPRGGDRSPPRGGGYRDRYSRNRSRSRSRSKSYNKRSPSPRFSRSSPPPRRHHSRSRSRSPEPRYRGSRRSRSR